MKNYKDSDKQFISILQFINKYGLEKVTNSCNLTISTGGCSAKLYEQSSLIITTHLRFEEWGDIFGNPKATK
ncbi:MAG: ATP-binding protein [Candidatus Megaira endosymbiont of Carteria cerasiformis]|nr:ATP-binding protein [Candidatus Megaera polyxenophila]MCC8461057.1 ATP-binding protein [Candidatus Megaera polyxenophila]